jgi:PAS domain S-box-containing protein
MMSSKPTPPEETNYNLEAEIAERKRSEAALRESEEKFRQLASIIQGAFWMTNATGTEVLYISPVYEQIWGDPPSYLYENPLSWQDAIAPEDRERILSFWSTLPSKAFQLEYQIIRPDGKRRWISDSGFPIYNERGEIYRFGGLLDDITERKQMEETLRQREQEFRALVENSPDIIARVNRDLHYIYVNPAIEQLLGLPPQDFIGKTHRDLELDDTLSEAWETKLHTVFATGREEVGEFGHLSPTGYRYYQSRYVPEFDAQGIVISVLSITRDITRLKQAETVLQKTNDELEARIEERTAALKQTVAQLRQEISERAQAEKALRLRTQRERLFGVVTQRIRQSLEVEAILTTTVGEVRRMLNTDRVVVYRFSNENWLGTVIVEDVVSPWRSVLGDISQDNCFSQSLISRYEAGYIRAINDITHANLDACHIAFLQTLQVKANLIVPIVIGQQLWGLLIAHECRDVRVWQPWEMVFLQQLADQVAIAIQQADLLTQTRQQAEQLQQTLRELQKTQTQLIQSEKMSSLGQLVAGIAHEINNPVNFVYGNLRYMQQYAQDLLYLLQLYQSEYPDPPAHLREAITEKDLGFLMIDFPKMISSMEIGSDRIREIIKALRNFSRLDEAEVKTVDIHQGIDSTLLILQHRLKANPEQTEVRVVKEYGNLPLVKCYPGQINQVFMNILSNAIDALDDQRRYPAAATQTKACEVHIQTEHISLDQIAIRITDTGPGIPPDVQARIFDPFFTTKPVGKGTGMGLAISYRIVVEKHCGQLTCKTIPGVKTEFTIAIPIDQAPASTNTASVEHQ